MIFLKYCQKFLIIFLVSVKKKIFIKGDICSSKCNKNRKEMYTKKKKKSPQDITDYIKIITK